MQRPLPSSTPRVKTFLAAGSALLIGAVAASSQDSSRRSDGLPLDGARFLVDGQPKLRGVFAGDVLVDAITIGEATFTREESTIHEVAAVRIYVRRGERWVIQSDEDLAAGGGPARFAVARDAAVRPTSALDALGGLAVSSLLATDGSADVRVDVLFPMGSKDDRPGEVDRTPEAILVGPPPDGAVSLAAIIAGDIDDPVLGGERIDVDPDAMRAGLSGVAVIFDEDERATPIAMLGFDLDEFGAEQGVLGWRFEVPTGVRASIKIFGTGESLTDMLASLDGAAPALAAFASGGDGGGATFSGLAAPAFAGSLIGGSIGLSGGGGGGGGGGGIRPSPGSPIPPAPQIPTIPDPPPPPINPGSPPPETPTGPDVPAPGTLVILAAVWLGRGRRRDVGTRVRGPEARSASSAHSESF